MAHPTGLVTTLAGAEIVESAKVIGMVVETAVDEVVMDADVDVVGLVLAGVELIALGVVI